MCNAAHGTLYALANSFAVTRAVAVPKWVKTTYAVDAVVAIILVAWEICAIRKYRKAKKEDEDGRTDGDGRFVPDKAAVETAYQRIFATETGKWICRSMFALGGVS